MADVTVNETSADPNEHYSCGFRAMVLGDYSTAVAAFGRCSELKAAAVGDKDDSLGETYYYYGKCLLEASREEPNELGDAIPNEEEDSTEDDEAAGEEVPEAMTNGDAHSTVENGDANGEPSTTTNGDVENAEADSTETGDAQTSQEDVEEDATDLQVAWEVLELAKMIFENRGDVAKEKLADTLILLGEVSLESENFESGIEDIQHGLEIHKSVYGEDNRKLAESYYKLGMAMLTYSRFDEAADNFKLSLKILSNVVKRLETADDKDGEKNKSEIDEVKALVPDIQEKINETKNYKKEALTALMSSITQATTPKAASSDAGASSSSSSSSAAPGSTSENRPNDISHLVKRKRKVEEGEAESSTTDAASSSCPAKKPSP